MEEPPVWTGGGAPAGGADGRRSPSGRCGRAAEPRRAVWTGGKRHDPERGLPGEVTPPCQTSAVPLQMGTLLPAKTNPAPRGRRGLLNSPGHHRGPVWAETFCHLAGPLVSSPGPRPAQRLQAWAPSPSTQELGDGQRQQVDPSSPVPDSRTRAPANIWGAPATHTRSRLFPGTSSRALHGWAGPCPRPPSPHPCGSQCSRSFWGAPLCRGG